jgi:hypothetical protein
MVYVCNGFFCNTMEFPLATFWIFHLQHSVFLLYNKQYIVLLIIIFAFLAKDKELGNIAFKSIRMLIGLILLVEIDYKQFYKILGYILMIVVLATNIVIFIFG